jgi:hypothetical protein
MNSLLYWGGMLLTWICGFVAGAIFLEHRAKEVMADVFQAYEHDVNVLMDVIVDLKKKLPADTKEGTGNADGGAV